MDEAERRGYENIFDDGAVRIYRRESSPRYYFTSEYQVMGASQALAAIGEPPVGRVVILETAPTFPSRQNRETDPAVSVQKFHRNSYTLAVEAPRPGLIYCSDSFARGWTARVNGRSSKVLPANFAFRAIEVPAGRVVVELSYRPPGLTAGWIVTSASLIVLLAGLWWAAGVTPALATHVMPMVERRLLWTGRSL